MRGGEDATAAALLVIAADVMRILIGFSDETSINEAKGATTAGWAFFGVGCLAWRNAGARQLAQDAESCVV